MKKIIYLLLIILVSVSCRESVTNPEEPNDDTQEYLFSMKDITSPSERVKWNKGSTYNIEWEITDKLDNVKIVLLKKFAKVGVISESTPNDGLFTWNISANLAESHHYRIKLVSPEDAAVSTTSIEFEVVDIDDSIDDKE